MTLAEYLEAEGIRPIQFAATLGVEPSTITRIIRGERGPSVDLAVRIEDATGGKVTPRDFLTGPVTPRASGEAA